MNRRAKIGLAAVLTTGVVAVTAVVVALPDAAGRGGTPSGLPPATARVTRQTLTDTRSHPADLGYGETTAIAARLSGTVTRMPAAGSVVTRGRALYRIDDDPVVLLHGTLPAYRRLAPGTEGADVAQFEKNLRALGYGGFTVDRTYSSATAAAVREWQDDLGVPETGAVDPARISYAPSAVRVDSRTAVPGAVVQPGAELLRTTGTARVATVELEIADQRLADKGAPVEVTLPDGVTIPATITGVETVVQPGEAGGEDTTKIRVTVSFPAGREPRGLDEASVDVAFTTARRENVLSVPVEALLALAEGGYGVQVVEGAATRIVAVDTGLFAGGRVEVTGDGITEGTTVGVPA